MSKRNDIDLLYDISEASRRIIYYTKETGYDNFITDIKTQDSVIRNIEIIGEAVKNLSEELRLKHKSIQWKNIAGMRDRLMHGYFGVNMDILWGVVVEDIPLLAQEVEHILSLQTKNG